MHALVNGAPAVTVGIDDRGLRYGDGLFETVAVGDRRPRLWEAHWARLAEGCHRLDIPVPDERTLRAELEALAPASGPAVARIIVTRGAGGRGYAVDGPMVPTRVVSMHPWPSATPASLRVGRCSTRLARSPALAGLKHLNRLEQVLAARELAGRWDEGLVADTAGHWVEGTRSNLFLVRDGCLVTPDLGHCGVAGVMRAAVIDAAARLGLTVRVEVVDERALSQAAELFLCNSVIGVRPVALLDGSPPRRLPAPGPVTARLAALLAGEGAFLP